MSWYYSSAFKVVDKFELHNDVYKYEIDNWNYLFLHYFNF